MRQKRHFLSYPNQSLGDMVRMSNESCDPVVPPPPPLRNAVIGKGRCAVLVISLLIGMLFSTIDTSIISTSLVTISHQLNDFGKSSWVILAYLLTYMGFAVCVAKLSDIYGRKNMIVISWVIFIAFSMACALSKTMIQLIVFRAFQGLGGSGLYSMAQIGLLEVGPSHKPSLIGAMIGLTLGIAFVLGPILGGIISRFSDWRWIFNINIPFGLATIAAVVSCWPEERVAHFLSWNAFRSIDFFGGVTLLCASGFLVLGLEQGGSAVEGWQDPVVVAALTTASVCWVVFIAWQTALGFGFCTKVQPMFPVRIVRSRVYMGGLVNTLLTGFSHLALIVIIPERFQIVSREDSLMAGLHLLPLLGACAIGSFLAGAVSSKRNNTSITLILASALQLLGVGLIALLDSPEEDTRAQYGYQAIFGLGVGLSYGAATILTGIHSSQSEDHAAAQGAIAQARVLGGCIGIAICTVVFNATSNRSLVDFLTPKQMADLRRSPLVVLTFNPPLQDIVRIIYARAFAEESRIMVYVCVAMFLLSFVTLERKRTSLERLTADLPRKNSRDTELSDLGSLRSV